MSTPSITPNHWTNLHWALETDSIARCADLPWLPRQRREALSAYFSLTETRTRLAPLLDAALAQSDAQGRGMRLGDYFEDLWAFAFTHHPDYRLRCRNLPLRTADRTLGELDFVVQHLPSGTTEHWEIAVKFYLQVADEYWVGPGLRDRLDIKLARMRDHQLPLIHQPQARQLLRQQKIHIDRQWALMPGRLFRPLDARRAPQHGELTLGGSPCWWAELDEFQHHFCRHSLRWVQLPKRAWLAPLPPGLTPGDTSEALAQRLCDTSPPAPLCVAGISAAGETERGFIVPHGWFGAALQQVDQGTTD
ncbi:hypothetical protein SAMN05660479_02559 [Microbulbifer thermotolerans]|uniref:DUF1853 family protein n=1 Tax=Microbulbifer thermotolerans TaxID=252514 RepID=UPI0008F368E0|nr:DUF1853 family protein [Microbulbifer thermotolerans]SFC85958.1 hypothetical protein SAMN05660479_02559 [Microbulbifer thermotolerans]